MKASTILIVSLVLVAAAGAAALLAVQFAPHPERASQGALSASAPSAPSETPVAAVEASSPTEPTPEAPAPVSAAPSRRVVATYFHNTIRCVTCRTIEQGARETIEAAFAEDLASGRLTWRALNMEEKENEHYAMDYQLPYPSLVLSELEGEREVRFKVLSETWNLVHKRDRFVLYVEGETRAFLGAL
jgi:hypothetical protein